MVARSKQNKVILPSNVLMRAVEACLNNMLLSSRKLASSLKLNVSFGDIEWNADGGSVSVFLTHNPNKQPITMPPVALAANSKKPERSIKASGKKKKRKYPKPKFTF